MTTQSLARVLPPQLPAVDVRRTARSAAYPVLVLGLVLAVLAYAALGLAAAALVHGLLV